MEPWADSQMPFAIDFDEFLYFLLLGGGTFLVGLYGTKAFIKAMHKRRILAMPNERSMHTLPTPTGAGWVVVIVAVLIFLFSHQPASVTAHWLIPALTFALALVSWYDDKLELPSALRFGLHIAAVALGLLYLADEGPILWDALPVWLDRLIAGICWLWFINLFNFMDGIDGIAGTEIVTIALGLLAVGLAVSLPLPTIELMVAIIGATLGFLWSNWHPAKVYLGDTGSIPLGFLLGWLLIGLAQQGYLIAALLIPMVFVADASFTLLRRMMKGEKFWRAHRTHFYQKATLAVRNPSFVVWRIALANALLIGAALLSLSHPYIGLLLGLAIVALLLAYLRHLGREH